MRLSTLVCTSVAVLSWVSGAPAQADDLYLHNFGGYFDSGEIGTVDPDTGAFTASALLTGISNPGTLHTENLTYVYDSAVAPDGTVYAVTNDYVVGAPSGYFARLWRIDLEDTSESMFIGYIGDRGLGPYFANALAFGPDGRLYAAGWPQLSSPEATVFELDIESTVYADDPYAVKFAVPTPIVSYGYENYAGDIAFTCDGDMYLIPQEADLSPLIRVDVEAGTVTSLPEISAGVDYRGLAYDPVEDLLYGVTYASEIYTIDRSTSAATLVSVAALGGPSGASWGSPPLDTDADGACDVVDVCPDGDDALDADGDGVPDDCDACPTDDASMDDLDADGCPDTPVCDIPAIMDYVASLPSSAFSNPSRQGTLDNKLSAVDGNYEAENFCGALHQISDDLLPKTDGLHPPPDWVVDPTAQAALEGLLLDCVDAILEQDTCP